MLLCSIALIVILGLGILLGPSAAGATGVLDRDAQRIDAELTAIADRAADRGR